MNTKYDASLTIQIDPLVSKEDKEFYKRLFDKANYILAYLKTHNSLVGELLNFKCDFYQFGLFSPYYKIDDDLNGLQDFLRNHKEQSYFDKLHEILSLFHISNKEYLNTGLYKNDNQEFVREPSVSVSYGLISKELNFLISCLITDLAFQQQESSIAFSRVGKENWKSLPDMYKGIGFVINFKNVSYEKILTFCFKNKLECTIGITKTVFIFYKIDSLDTKEFQEHESTILNLCKEIDKHNYLKGTIAENMSYHYLNFKFLTKEIRNELYDTIIKTYINE